MTVDPKGGKIEFFRLHFQSLRFCVRVRMSCRMVTAKRMVLKDLNEPENRRPLFHHFLSLPADHTIGRVRDHFCKMT